MTDLNLQFLFNDEATRKKLVEQVRNDAGSFQLSLKYRAYYRFLRPIMPIAVRQLMQRRRKIETADRWYQPAEFMRSLTDCLEASDQDLNTVHPWPAAAKFAFVLTHDVETAEGMRHIARIADAEERLGFRSSWNLVPYKYPIDMGLVNDLKARGFEIGIHGYNHDGRLFCSPQTFARRGVAINEAIKKYGAVGFRAPMVHRNLNWLQSLDVEYDSSCFDIDPFQAAPGGVGSLWPFIAGRFVELPYTLPQDHTLFVTLGERDDSIWKDKLDYIFRHQGMALMLTHPDYLTGRRESDIYFRFLEHVEDIGDYWHATPMKVARWWREREQTVEFDLPPKNSCSPEHPVNNRYQIAKLVLNGNGFQFVSR